MAIRIGYGNYIPNGYYFYSDGNISSEAYHLYFESWKKNENGDYSKKVNASLPTNNIIRIDSDSYDSYYAAILVEPRVPCDEVTFYPMISVNHSQFEPAWVLGGKGKYKK